MDAGSVKRVECDEDPTTSQKTARPSRHFNTSHKKMSKFDFAPPPPQTMAYGVRGSGCETEFLPGTADNLSEIPTK